MHDPSRGSTEVSEKSPLHSGAGTSFFLFFYFFEKDECKAFCGEAFMRTQPSFFKSIPLYPLLTAGSTPETLVRAIRGSTSRRTRLRKSPGNLGCYHFWGLFLIIHFSIMKKKQTKITFIDSVLCILWQAVISECGPEMNRVCHLHQPGEEFLVILPWKGDKSDIIHATLKNSCSKQNYLCLREDEMFKASSSREADWSACF